MGWHRKLNPKHYRLTALLKRGIESSIPDIEEKTGEGITGVSRFRCVEQPTFS